MGKFFKKQLPQKYGEKSQLIARGAFGAVYSTTKGYAVKINRNPDPQDGENVGFLREVITLRAINHPNIVKILAIADYKSKKITFMEQATETLDSYIVKLHHNRVDETLSLFYIYQLLQALDYCHRNYIIHRDVKPQNILLFNDGKLQLADFGISRTCITTGETHTEGVVTLWWRAPEILLGQKKYSYEVDIWSAGVITLTLLLRENLFQGISEIDQLYKIFKVLGTPTTDEWPTVTSLPNWNNNTPMFPKRKLDLQPLETDLVYELLAWPHQRATAAKALSNPYFDTVRTVNTETDIEKYQYPVKTNFSSKFRTILFDWLWDITISYKFCYNTLFIAYNIFDRYLEHHPDIPKSKIQGYGAAAMLIASKLQDVYYPPVSDFVYLTVKSFTAKEICKMERDILIALDYKILHHPYNHTLKNSNSTVSSETLVYLAAIYMNYDWITEWSAEECLTTVQQYLNGENPTLCDRDTMRAYFSSLGGKIGKKIAYLQQQR